MQHMSAEQSLQALELTQLDGKLGGGTGGDSQPPWSSRYHLLPGPLDSCGCCLDPWVSHGLIAQLVTVAEWSVPVQGGRGAAGRKLGNLGIQASLCGKSHLCYIPPFLVLTNKQGNMFRLKGACCHCDAWACASPRKLTAPTKQGSRMQGGEIHLQLLIPSQPLNCWVNGSCQAHNPGQT